MPENPDMKDLARRYLDLWQEQLTTLAGDQDMAKVMSEAMTMMSSGTQAFVDAAGKSVRTTPEEGDDRTPERPPPTAPDHGNSVLDIAEFHQRLAALEKRVAELESEATGRGSTSSKGRRKHKS